MKVRKCELCNADAAVFCPSDAAFLCRSCDAKVHGANFLVARHLRRAVCANCSRFTGDSIAGVGFRPSAAAACPSCPPASSAADDDDLGSLSSTDSSACVSSTTSPAKVCSDSSSTVTVAKRRRTTRSRVNHLKSEGIFVNWCGKLGVETGLVARAACRALKVCVERWTALPFRVCLAASMWLGLRLSLEKPALTWKVLKRLEEISGVPAKIIFGAETKLARAVRGEELDHRRRLELEEGWAEC